MPPFTVAWLRNFTGDGRNGGHSILPPPSDALRQTEGEVKREMLIWNVATEEKQWGMGRGER